MALTYSIVYHHKVVSDDIPTLPSLWKDRIKKTIEEKLTIAPEVFGKPLRRSLKNYRKLRVGDYRVVFRIEGREVKIIAILHRSVVYDQTPPRS